MVSAQHQTHALPTLGAAASGLEPRGMPSSGDGSANWPAASREQAVSATLDALRVPGSTEPHAQAASQSLSQYIPSEPATFVDEQAPSEEAAYWEDVRQRTEGKPGFLASEAGSAVSEPPDARGAKVARQAPPPPPPPPPPVIQTGNPLDLSGPRVRALQPADPSPDPVQRIVEQRSRHMALRFPTERLYRALAHQRQVNHDNRAAESTSAREGTTRKITMRELEAFKQKQLEGPRRGGHEVSAHM